MQCTYNLTGCYRYVIVQFPHTEDIIANFCELEVFIRGRCFIVAIVTHWSVSLLCPGEAPVSEMARVHAATSSVVEIASDTCMKEEKEKEMEKDENTNDNKNKKNNR